MEQEQAANSNSSGTGISLLMLRTFFEYSIWARDRLLGVIEGLDETLLREMPGGDAGERGEAGGVYGTIYDTLAHLAASEWLWIQRCMNESPTRSPRGEDFADLRMLIAWWNSVHADAIGYLANIDESDLDHEITYVGPDNKRRTRKVWHMLLQVPNHQTEHRSQIAGMLGNMGLEVPQTDMVVYLSELGSK